MTPKKGQKGYAAHMTKEWTKSASTQKSIEHWVWEGVLPAEATARWQAPSGESYPKPNPGECIVFEDSFIRGFGLPAHPFLAKLIDYYKISLHHLHPNSILSVSIFIHLCEAYIGIPLHFNLFRHFYQLKLKGKNLGGSPIAGGVYIVLRDGMKGKYIDVPLNSSKRDWYKKWFYMNKLRRHS